MFWYYHKVWDLSTEFDDSATLSDGKNETGLPPAGHIVHDSKCNLYFICIYLSNNSENPCRLFKNNHFSTITSECHLLFYYAVWVQALNWEYMVQPGLAHVLAKST